MAVSFLPCGDTGLTVQFGFEIDRQLSQQIMALRLVIDDAEIEGVVETVPTYRSLLVHYDPLLTTQAELIAQVEPLVGRLDAIADTRAHEWELPICFEADLAPDLDNVAAFAGQSREEVMATLTSIEHFVYMLGFAPGLPYMGDLPEVLNIPRKKVPVKKVAKGSVMVATGLTLIYPTDNPTGWHVVGRCPVPVFDLRREAPVLVAPGDRVRFKAIEMAQFREIEDQVADGRYDISEAMA